MASRITNIFPFLLITLLSVGGVEGLYLSVERYLLNPVDKVSLSEDLDQAEVKAPAPAVAMKVNNHYSIIMKRNLFGPPPDEKKKTAEATASDPFEDLGTTTLDIVLMGTIEGVEGHSRAIILTKKDKKQDIYQPGDYVQDALVKEILRGKVILNFKGKDEILDMSEAAQYAPKVTSRPVSVTPSVRRNKVLAAPTASQSSKPPIVRPTRRVIRSQKPVTKDDN